MALNEVKVEMLSIITHISVQEMIDTYMVTFLPDIQTCPLGLTSGYLGRFVIFIDCYRSYCWLKVRVVCQHLFCSYY